MIENLGAPGYETISGPNPNATPVIQALLSSGNMMLVVVENGAGIGATTVRNGGTDGLVSNMSDGA
jgi:hypothetical protein